MKFLYQSKINGTGDKETSTKKIFYVLASIGSLIGPIAFRILELIDSHQMMDFYSIVVPMHITGYVAGKLVDGKNGH